MLYFNDYNDTTFHDLRPDCHDELPTDDNLVKFPNNQTKVNNQEIGKYVDMLMQMPEGENSPENSGSLDTNDKNRECEKLADILLRKGIL